MHLNIFNTHIYICIHINVYVYIFIYTYLYKWMDTKTKNVFEKLCKHENHSKNDCLCVLCVYTSITKKYKNHKKCTKIEQQIIHKTFLLAAYGG